MWGGERAVCVRALCRVNRHEAVANGRRQGARVPAVFTGVHQPSMTGDLCRAYLRASGGQRQRVDGCGGDRHHARVNCAYLTDGQRE